MRKWQGGFVAAVFVVVVLVFVVAFDETVHKGRTLYRDPDSGPGRGHKTLHVVGDMDLTRVRPRCCFVVVVVFVVLSGAVGR